MVEVENLDFKSSNVLVHGCIISRVCMHPKRVTGAQGLGWTPARACVISDESGMVQAAAGLTHGLRKEYSKLTHNGKTLDYLTL